MAKKIAQDEHPKHIYLFFCQKLFVLIVNRNNHYCDVVFAPLFLRGIN